MNIAQRKTLQRALFGAAGLFLVGAGLLFLLALVSTGSPTLVGVVLLLFFFALIVFAFAACAAGLYVRAGGREP
jgi:hypothetical protein